jgi:hypothetical protein
MPAARSYPPPNLTPEPLPQVPVKLTPPLKPPTPRPSCIVEEKPDGGLTVTFDITADGASKFVRQACGRDMAEFLWETRRLRLFEMQPIV